MVDSTDILGVGFKNPTSFKVANQKKGLAQIRLKSNLIYREI